MAKKNEGVDLEYSRMGFEVCTNKSSIGAERSEMKFEINY